MTKEITQKKKETRKDYLLRVALAYLKKIKDSEYDEALSTKLEYDNARCDGDCLIDDIEMEIDE